MTVKKVYFYAITLKQTIKNEKINDRLKDILENIFERECTNNDGIKTMTINCQKENISLDILKEDGEYLFGRVSKPKDSSYALIRDNETKRCENVLTEEDILRKNLEICTYFLLDYTTGIIGYITGKSAPTVYSLTNIVNQYDANYFMTIDCILNPESVNALISAGTEIGRIKYTYRVPNVEILSYLGLNREQIVALGETDVQEIELVIKSEPRKPLAKGHPIIQTLINAFRNLPNNVKETVNFIGKTETTATQSYKFEEQNIIFSIDVPNEKIHQGIKRKLTVNEVADKIFENLKKVYIENREHLIRFANIE